MSKMLVAKMFGYGDPSEKIKLVEEMLPELVKGTVLVKVKYASINPVDQKILSGWYRMVQRIKFPISIGFDLAGEVVDSGVTDIPKGSEIFCSLPHTMTAAFAEYCLVPEELCVLKPEEVSYKVAAASAMTGLTTIQAFRNLGVGKGDKVLIHAGSGGVGSMAIQYAVHLGAHVITTTSSKNADWVKGLGANQVIRYDLEDYSKVCPEVDHVLDTLGKEHSFKSLQVLKEGGNMVCISGGVDDKTAKSLGVNAFFRFLIRMSRRSLMKAVKAKKVNYSFVLMRPNGADLRELASLLRAGIINPVVDEEYELKEIVKAYQKIMTNRVKGKIVIRIT